jgi:hypothetical protein
MRRSAPPIAGLTAAALEGLREVLVGAVEPLNAYVSSAEQLHMSGSWARRA